MRNEMIYIAWGGSLVIGPMVVLYLLISSLLSPDTDYDYLLLLSGILAIFYVLTAALGHIFYVRSLRLAQTISYEMRMGLAEKLLRLPMSYFSDKRSGEIFTTLDDYCTLFFIKIMNSTRMIREAVTAMVISAFFLALDWRMALLAFMTFPAIYLTFRRVDRIMTDLTHEGEEATRTFNSTVVEFIQGMPVIKVFNLGKDRMTRFRKAAEDFRDHHVKMIVDTTGPSLQFLLFLSLDIVIVLPFGYYLYSIGEVQSNTLIFFIVTVPLLSDALYHFLYGYIENHGKMAEVLRKVRELRDSPEPTAPSEMIDVNGNDIVFQDVSFSYGDKETLSHIDLVIPAGKVTALVGPSGAGKTTLTSLIARFWDASSGEIRIGGINIREMNMDTLMSKLSFVFQDVIVFDDTVMENIRIGRPGASDEEVIEAARAARCEEFVSTMMLGYQTMLGERGSRLSEGQKQRLSIARAILKNAPILIMDEATVFVDPNNEYEIQEAINELTEGKTVIVIAHRLSVIAKADQIVVIQQGRVVERGTHDELIGNNGQYGKFWDMQTRTRQWHI
ncbi:MAG: ABC transporter ATP-binding protein/permease [Methanomassiliicoccales archaeon]|nr:ABC transporter ATP-binding protein/permease [Methanomassiliicoccales archaeon]